jgi:hypothetical protein
MKLLCDECVELGETITASYLKVEHGSIPTTSGGTIVQQVSRKRGAISFYKY